MTFCFYLYDVLVIVVFDSRNYRYYYYDYHIAGLWRVQRSKFCIFFFGFFSRRISRATKTGGWGKEFYISNSLSEANREGTCDMHIT